MTRARVFVIFAVLFIMVNHSWAENSLACSQKRFRQLLFRTSTKIMFDKGQVGRDYWDLVKREKETARKLNELLFTCNLYENHDY